MTQLKLRKGPFFKNICVYIYIFNHVLFVITHLCHKSRAGSKGSQTGSSWVADFSDKRALTQSHGVKVCRCRCFLKLQRRIDWSVFACCITTSHFCISCHTGPPREGGWMKSARSSRQPCHDSTVASWRGHKSPAAAEKLSEVSFLGLFKIFLVSCRVCSELRHYGFYSPARSLQMKPA